MAINQRHKRIFSQQYTKIPFHNNHVELEDDASLTQQEAEQSDIYYKNEINNPILKVKKIV